MSQTSADRCCTVVSTPARVVPIDSAETPSDFEGYFHAHYLRVARTIAFVIRDTGRAEELAVDVFWQFWQNPKAHNEKAGGWLHRTAVRMALNELRRRKRSDHYERLSAGEGHAASPEEIRAAVETQEHVREVLASLEPRQAELLTLRANGFSYEEVAVALELNPASVGTLLARAQQAFRKQYVAQYGEQDDE